MNQIAEKQAQSNHQQPPRPVWLFVPQPAGNKNCERPDVTVVNTNPAGKFPNGRRSISCRFHLQSESHHTREQFKDCRQCNRIQGKRSVRVAVS